jgi:outer membrane receptor for ferrienterochelin and colicin
MKNINTLSEVQQPTNDITLLSEYLHSFQLTLASTKWVDGLDLELTGYYNRATNLIYKSVLTHENAGIMKSIGAELTGSYRKGRLAANLTVSWQHVLESEIYQRDISTAYSIPQLTVNAVLGWNVTKRLRLNTHLVVESKKSCYQVDLVKQTLVESTLDPLALLTLGARYSFGFIEIGANCHNLFNTLYYRGGFSSGLIPQQGRSFMGYVSLKF